MKIFISYAKEDFEIAKRLYGDLIHEGFEPWDQDDILPGQHINLFGKGIKDSSLILLLLSVNSVSKRGESVKQQKFVLKLLDEIPDSEIFIIPVRLDECELLDERLQKLKAVDLFPSYENGVEKILKSLRHKKSDQTESSATKGSDRIEDAPKSVSGSSNAINIGKDAEGNIILSGNDNIITIVSSDQSGINQPSSQKSKDQKEIKETSSKPSSPNHSKQSDQAPSKSHTLTLQRHLSR